jgi:hypothetical protein
VTKGTGGIEDLEATRFGLITHRLGDAVGAEDDGAAGWHFVKFLDEHRALGTQVVADKLVVHDFMAHVDRRTEFSRARSTMAMARSTPAQKPRGLARMTCIT